MDLSRLLENGTPPSADIAPLIRNLYENLRQGILLAPPDLHHRLQEFCSSLPPPPAPHSTGATSTPAASFHAHSNTFTVSPPLSPSKRTSPSPYKSLWSPTPSKVEFGVKINRQLTVNRLLTFEDTGVYIEYPETHPDGVAYLLRQDPDNWRNPFENYAYSLGDPKGKTKEGEHVLVKVLMDSASDLVPCVMRRRTCQGVKVCPMVDAEAVREPHNAATPQLIEERLAHDHEQRLEFASPTAEIYQETLHYLTALQRVGCRAKEACNVEAGSFNEFMKDYMKTLQRGYRDKIPRCSGEMVFEETEDGRGIVRCQFYDAKTSRSHFRQHLTSAVDSNYVRAVLENNIEEVGEIEGAAEALGYGPTVECNMVANFGSKRLNCTFAHRDNNGHLMQPLMERLECVTVFRRFDPVDELRHTCPWTLVVIQGTHKHPIPLPQTTPPLIRQDMFNMFEAMDEDLADLTARRFLRHPLLRTYVNQVFPDNPLCALSQIHPSLANRAHIRNYIKQAKDLKYPNGTSWAGAVDLWKKEVAAGVEETRYIRRVIDEREATPYQPEDVDVSATDGADNLRIMVCMSKEASTHLLSAQYLQSDISFKRVVQYREFIVAGRDRDLNTTIVYCRVYLNRETAEAHRRVFRAIEDIVREDTGRSLMWRHLYANDLEEREGCILQWTSDQHGGQAKGLGLHLQDIASNIDSFDLHEPLRHLQSLSPYEHLHRLLRVCSVHFKRNIRDSGLPYPVQEAMRSLSCVEHPAWDETVQRIITEGGKKGGDWVANKVNSYFAFEGLCQVKSKIPLDIWCAGDSNDNVVETAHFHANSEGRKCTLLGALVKGRRYDSMRMATLKAHNESGIRASYKTGTRYDNTAEALRRTSQQTHQRNERRDTAIESHNAKVDSLIRKASALLHKGRELAVQVAQQVQCVPQDVPLVQLLQGDIRKAEAAFEKTKRDMRKLNEAGKHLPLGSGSIQVHVPNVAN